MFNEEIWATRISDGSDQLRWPTVLKWNLTVVAGIYLAVKHSIGWTSTITLNTQTQINWLLLKS